MGALVAFAGAAIVIGGSQALSLGSSIVGDALTLGAAAVWAVYTVGASRVIHGIDTLQATAWAVTAGAAFLVPLGIAESIARPAPVITPAAILAILYSGALAAGIANVFVFNAIRYVGPHPRDRDAVPRARGCGRPRGGLPGRAGRAAAGDRRRRHRAGRRADAPAVDPPVGHPGAAILGHMTRSPR